MKQLVLVFILLLCQSIAGEEKPFYKINIGDTLKVALYGQPNSEKEVTVDPYGNIDYIYAGTVKSYGKTIPELTKDLNDLIKPILKHSLVTVSPVDFGGRYYYIAGTVNSPGRKVLIPGTTILSALAQGGGLKLETRNGLVVESSDLKHAFLLRNGENIPVNFTELVKKGNMEQNTTLEKGDFIYIPEAVKKEVYILGQVRLQKSVDLARPISILQLITQAGGLRDDASSDILVLRGTLTDPAVKIVNYSKLLAGETKNFFLKADDIVFVPERSTVLAEDLVKLAIRAFVARIATLSGSEVYKEIQPTFNNNDSDDNFNFDLSP